MKKLVLYAILPVWLLAGCKSPKDNLSKLWFYTYNTGSSDPRDTLLTPASFLDLQRTGNYTMDFNGFEAGTWELDGPQLVLTNTKKIVTKIPIRYASGKDLRIYVHESVFEFEGLPNQFAGEAEDPFSVKNNLWRIHADAKETDQQITARLSNHFGFWIAYFTWALDHDIQYVDVRSTPTPVKIYGNGFGLKPFTELPAIWKSYFYDEEDCRKANAKIERLFDYNSIAWPHTDNKFKFFISAFQQLKQKI
ncbi:MAG TPA: hypothetical protein VGM41_14955 [Chitinophagaceae bacterium]